MSNYTRGDWGLMHDGPVRDDYWEPWRAHGETASGGLTIGSDGHTEPICRVSGYLHNVQANARLIIAAPKLLRALQDFVDYYDQVGIGECLAGQDDADAGDEFDGDERFNVRQARAALAAAQLTGAAT
jgi:hypothetical protein